MWGGIADLSLRELAAAIGTSHRRLLYHFGSREGLLVAIARAVEEAERARFLSWAWLLTGLGLFVGGVLDLRSHWASRVRRVGAPRRRASQPGRCDGLCAVRA
jgi:AcrR family transcriptional regulator